MQHHLSTPRTAIALLNLIALSSLTTSVQAVPEGYRKTTIDLNSPPVGLAFDASGVLYAMEGAPFGTNLATIRVIHPSGSFDSDILLAGDDENNFFIGGMTYDPPTDGLLITDNTADGRLYSVSKSGTKQLLASGIPAIAGVAVRSSGEIFVSTSLGDNVGEVLQVDRTTGSTSTVLAGIDYGAGLAFDSTGDLIVQEADANTFAGRIQRVPIDDSGSALAFGSPIPMIADMQSSAGIVLDSEGDLFSTGSGGLFAVAGNPLMETSFDSDSDPSQYATAIAFDAGTAPFEPFTGPDGGRLAMMGNFGFSSQDTFITLIEPLLLPSADFNEDSWVDVTDLDAWQVNYGLAGAASLAHGDADGDQDVDGKDFLVWQRQYTPVPELPGSLSIPEPHALLLAGTFLLAIAVRRT